MGISSCIYRGSSAEHQGFIKLGLNYGRLRHDWLLALIAYKDGRNPIWLFCIALLAIGILRLLYLAFTVLVFTVAILGRHGRSIALRSQGAAALSLLPHLSITPFSECKFIAESLSLS